MNNLLQTNISRTMTSVELVNVINELRDDDRSELRHDHFMAKIEKVLGIDAPKFRATYLDGANRPQPCYSLPKREASLMVMSESYAVQAKVYDRMEDLETRAPRELTRLEVLEIALETEKRNIALTAELAAAAPAIEFVDRYVDSTGLKGFRQVCKLIKAKEPAFREFLKDKKIMYVLGREWVPFAEHIAAGRFEVKAGAAQVSGHAYNSALFTPKGVTWIAAQWAVHNLPKE